MITIRCPFTCYDDVSDCPHIDKGVCYNFEENADDGAAWCTSMIGFAIYHIELAQEDAVNNPHPAL